MQAVVARCAGGFLLGAALLCSSVASAVNVDEYLSDARAYFERGEYNAGVIKLKNALQIDPENASARFLLSDVYIRLGDGAAAEKELTRARKLGLGRDSWVVPMAKSYLLQGKRNQVLDEINVEPGDSPDIKAKIYAVRGSAHLAARQLLESEEAFANAIKADPNNTDAELGMTRILLSRSQFAEGRKRLDRVLKIDSDNVEAWALMGELHRVQGQYPDALKALNKAVSLSPQNPASRLVRADTYLTMNDLDKAKADIDFVLKARPNLPYGQYLKAKLVYQQGDTPAAEQALREVFRASPSHKPSQLLMGLVQFNLGNMQLAEDYLSRYMSSTGLHLPAVKLLASTYMRLDQPEKAREILQQGLVKFGDDAQLFALVGSSYIVQNEPNKAAEALKKAIGLNPDEPAYRAQLARAEMALGDTNAAIGQLEKAVGGDRELVEADIMLVLAHMNQKDMDAAAKAAAGLAERRQNDPVSFNLLGVVLLGKGDLKAAREQFQKAVDLKPTFAVAELNLALVDRYEGDVDSARRRLENILKYNPDHVEAMMGLARLAQDRGDNTASLKYLEQGWLTNKGNAKIGLELVTAYLRLNKNLNALNVARDVSGSNSKNANVLKRMALLLMQNGEYAEAISTFQKVVYLEPESSEIRYLLASAQLRDERRSDAKSSLRDALSEDENYLPALIMKAKILLQDREFEQALAPIMKVQKAVPNQAVGYQLEGDVMRQRGQFEDAGRLYQKAIDIQPASDLALLLADSYRQAGDKTAVIRTLSQWVDKYPNDVRVKMVLASTYQGDGDNANAIKVYEGLLEAVPTNVVVMNNLAWLYFQAGDQRSVPLAEKAVEIAPETPEIVDTLGWILVQQGEARRGLRYLKQAALGSPDNAEIRYHLAVGYNKLGLNDQAVNELQRLISADKSFPQRSEAEELLRKLTG